MDPLIFGKEIQRILVSLNKKVMTNVKCLLQHYAITPFQYHILLIVERSHTIPVTKVADEMKASPSVITASITRLYELDLVERYHSKRDRRKVMIELTNKGKQVIQVANKDMQQEVEKLFACYKEEEQQQFLTLCRQLDEHVT
ncbi:MULTISPECIES: MarR family winged helix-turn-helix transcriptional regulator [Priestia]|jgi:MarR family transcriptional regulator, organic hydroperoxide resistance regulator|uniref:MarR family winged helix-turn-helix transcriptional regulator n=1 Tax=Priestia TaxID=2800373 RepID=UPI00203E9B1F|nr:MULTISPECIES: MarR family transcriptional regulator [Priestia]MCM3772157.1 MarR family transcriptional regulator [Priestia aryabhattai]MDY0940438.1 MarR family transcriptional regulator [Priestia megaterium]